jgi:hypothetical protein
MLRRYFSTPAIIFLGLWLILMTAGRSRFFIDPGSLWHVVVGEGILARHRFPHFDTFSCTCAGQPWIAQQWLGECVLAILHRLGGLDAILLATATMLAGLYAWVGHRLIRGGMHPLIAVLVVALTVLAGSYHVHPRPHLVNVAMVGWTFACLVDFEAGRTSLGSLFWLVPLYALWANVHGGMVGGVLTLGLTTLGWGLAKVLGRPTPLAGYRQLTVLGALIAACGLTALVNPYGLEMPRVWFGLMGSPVLPQIIQEHFPLYSAGPVAWTVVLFGAVYLAALLGVPAGAVRVTWLVPLAWFALTITRIRHGPLFAITAALALGEAYAHVRWRAWLAQTGSVTCRLQDEKTASIGWRAAIVPFLVVLTALGLETAGARVPLLGRGWAHFDPDATPVGLLPDLVACQKQAPEGQPIFNDMLYGGFLIYCTPGLKVFIDDRCELYGDAVLAHYAEAYHHHPEWIEDWRREQGFELALVVPGSAFDRYLRGSNPWVLVRETTGAVLYRRARGEGRAARGE